MPKVVSVQHCTVDSCMYSLHIPLLFVVGWVHAAAQVR